MRPIATVTTFVLLFLLSACQHSTSVVRPKLTVVKAQGSELLLVNRMQDPKHCRKVVQRAMSDQVSARPLSLLPSRWNTLRVIKLNKNGRRFAMAFSFVPEMGQEYRLSWSLKQVKNGQKLSLEIQGSETGQQRWQTIAVKPRAFSYRQHRLAFSQHCQESTTKRSSIDDLMAHITPVTRLTQVRANQRTAQGMLVVDGQ